MAKRLEDNDLMPHGKYKGQKMKDVPDHYLIWAYINDRLKPEVSRYVKNNFNILTGKRNGTKN